MEASTRSRKIVQLTWITAAFALTAQGCLSAGDVPPPISRAQAPDGKSAPIVPLTPTTPVAPATPASVREALSLDAGPKMTTQVRLVASIGTDVAITDEEVWQLVRMRPDARQGGVDHEREIFREELRRLIERELILQDFLGKIKKQKPGVLDELKTQANRMAQKKIKELRRLNKKTESEFAEFLAAIGLSGKGLERHFERDEMKNIYVGQIMRDKEFFKSITLTEIERYYKAHPQEFKVEDRVKWLDLFVSGHRFVSDEEARKYADNLRKEAMRSGADFVQIVKTSGHGDSVLRDGEGIGTKPGEITPRDLEPTIWKLEAGQISDVVPVSSGYHIVKVVEREKAGIRPYDEQTQYAIRGKLAQKAVELEYDKLIDDLWRKTNVTVFDLP